jgi:hypothetical protein
MTAGLRTVASKSAAGTATAGPVASATDRVTGKMAEQTLQRARTPAAGTLAGSTR